MRITKALLSLALVANAVDAKSWLSDAGMFLSTRPLHAGYVLTSHHIAYNKWHQTELERWLSDHGVPYSTPSDRRELEKLVKQNWDANVVEPYSAWDTEKLTSYLKQKGIDTKESAQQSRDSLVAQVRGTWYESEDSAQRGWVNVKDWILDTWTDSQLKAFCDRNNIPVPQPRKRDTLLQKARENYEAVAKKAGEAAAYPGNWLYESWSGESSRRRVSSRINTLCP